MQPKQQVIMSGGVANSYVTSQPFTVLGYAKTIFTIRYMGGGSGITYRVQATPRLSDSLAPWITLLSGTDLLLSGSIATHKVTDPWDAVRVQAQNKQSNRSGSVIVWVNGDPR